MKTVGVNNDRIWKLKLHVSILFPWSSLVHIDTKLKTIFTFPYLTTLQLV